MVWRPSEYWWQLYVGDAQINVAQRQLHTCVL